MALTGWLPLKRWFSCDHVQPRPQLRRPGYVPQRDQLEVRLVLSFVSLLPGAGTVQQDPRGPNAEIDTPEGDAGPPEPHTSPSTLRTVGRRF